MNINIFSDLTGSAFQSGGTVTSRSIQAGGDGPAPVASAPSVGSTQEVHSSALIQASVEDMKRLAEKLHHWVGIVAPELQFSVDQNSGQTIIKITDRTTNEVIRQIPSEEALQIDKLIDDFQQRLLLNQQA